jgi:hypothetical protein
MIASHCALARTGKNRMTECFSQSSLKVAPSALGMRQKTFGGIRMRNPMHYGGLEAVQHQFDSLDAH